MREYFFSNEKSRPGSFILSNTKWAKSPVRVITPLVIAQLMVNCWFGLVVWIPRIPLWKRLLLRGTPRIPNHRAPNQHLNTISWITGETKTVTRLFIVYFKSFYRGSIPALITGRAHFVFQVSSRAVWISVPLLGLVAMSPRTFSKSQFRRFQNDRIVADTSSCEYRALGFPASPPPCSSVTDTNLIS